MGCVHVGGRVVITMGLTQQEQTRPEDMNDESQLNRGLLEGVWGLQHPEESGWGGQRTAGFELPPESASRFRRTLVMQKKESNANTII